MGRLRTELHRTLVHPLSKLVGSAMDGISGRGRKRRYQALEAALETAYEERDRLHAERDRLQAEIQDLIQYTDTELAHFKQANEQLCRERDALQLQVWTLEEQIEALTQCNEAVALSDESLLSLEAVEAETVDKSNPKTLSSSVSTSIHYAEVHAADGGNDDNSGTATGAIARQSSTTDPPPSSPTPRIDLSNLRLALVGGHPTTRRGVIEELQLYGLRHWVEVPRMNEANTNRSKVKSKISQCTLVVLITGYMSHRLTEIIFSLKEAGSLAGDVLQLNCKGKSGVIREILNHIEHVGG